MREFLIPLLSLLLGAAIAIASSIFIERYRDRRSALAAALVIREDLQHVINVLGIATATDNLRPLRAVNASRFLDAWSAHKATLARSMPPTDWTLVSGAFSGFESLVLFAEKRWDDPSFPATIEATTAFVPIDIQIAKAALQTLESLYGLPETSVSDDPIDRLGTLATVAPQLAEQLRKLHDESPPPA